MQLAWSTSEQGKPEETIKNSPLFGKLTFENLLDQNQNKEDPHSGKDGVDEERPLPLLLALHLGRYQL